MAKNMEPIAKRCKALGISPAVMGYTNKETFRNSYNKNRRKKSEYAMQLTKSKRLSSSTVFLKSNFTPIMRKQLKWKVKPVLYFLQ